MEAFEDLYLKFRLHRANSRNSDSVVIGWVFEGCPANSYPAILELHIANRLKI